MEIAQWDSLQRRHNVDLYLSGHDHDLQHLEFEGHPTSFVISGGGGAELVEWTTPPEQRGPWGLRALGFTDLQISKEEVVVQTYRQGCNRPLRVQKAGRHHRTLVIASRTDYFFSATRMHIPDHRSCPNPDGESRSRASNLHFWS
jgi:hypothetical protein